MEAVQRMRKKAKDSGNLKSNEQQKVETKVIESKSVIVVEHANPQLVYVPSYNPVVVYGPPVYAYPPISYPPPGILRSGNGDLLWSRRCHGCVLGRRWLGLWMRLGWQQ
jgi:hypothetical protein